MTKKYYIKRLCMFFLMFLLTLSAFSQSSVGNTDTKNKGVMAAEPINYIYFDLAAGNVKISNTKYSGYVYVKEYGDTPQPVTGDHKDGNHYYIYQSNLNDETSVGYYTKTGYGSINDYNNKTNCIVPQYPRVKQGNKSWNEYITNNKDVYEVSNTWETAAKDAYRKPTKNYITFEKASHYTANVTIDNIWSNYVQASTSRRTGGIGAHLTDSEGTSIKINLKGDNRFGCVHYASHQGKGNTIEFNNAEVTGSQGSLTVGDFPDNFAANHWNAVIGAADNVQGMDDPSDGIIINSGYIFAGSTAEDNCTAIGGGGNNYGGVTINGGTITAVVSSTGTAIGGGIGYSNQGGDADVTITNGTIYAYNLGIVKKGTPGYGNLDDFAKFVPAAAIGGGGSKSQAGGLTVNIDIQGGIIYAQSMGGAAIGGGCSADSAGGPANITISGGTIIAKSVGGTYGNETIDPGVSIGGGTGKTAGGSVELSISGEKTIVRTGSIGGGLATATGAKVGSANVEISGGNIIGQIIMAGGATNPCSFIMTDGTIHSTNVIDGVTIGNTNITGVTVTDPQPSVPLSFIEKNGGAVFMDDMQGVAIITGGLIGNCTANNGGAVYMTGGTFILSGTGQLGTNHAKESGGSVYIGGGTVQIGGTVNRTVNGNNIVIEEKDASKCAIRNSDAVLDGGGVYVGNGTVNIKGGSIRDNTANKNGGGMYVGNGSITLSGKMSSKAVEVVENGQKYFTISTTSIKRNKAAINGGGMYVDKGNITIESGEINYNESVNGAGMYVGNGTVTMSNGSIHDNTASQSGGGMYVSGTADITSGNVTINGGSIKFNKAVQDGGGMFVADGTITINKVKPSDATNPFISTEISNNKADGNGGGVFVTGDVYMLNGSVTKNWATNGGGFCIEDGNVFMYGGSIDNNIVVESGGGIHISAISKAPIVDILSGSISGNQSKQGGGVSVISANDLEIHVTVGVNCVHPNLDLNTDDRTFDSFVYPSAGECGDAHNGHNHYYITETSVKNHSSCPQITNNVALNNGGGFYLQSSGSYLVFYCVIENGNVANGNTQCYDMDVKGGHVIIGDTGYDPNGTNPVKGNIIMKDSILVEGGTVDIYGTMDNPKFTTNITVEIESHIDYFCDHRINNTNIVSYKVHYYENFNNTGSYIARQYPDAEHENVEGDARFDFTVMASMFQNAGYKIVGWNTKPDGTGDTYEVNGTYNLKELHNAGKLGGENQNGQKDDSLLIIYAIWEKKGYVLNFNPNVGVGEPYTGTMENQRVTVGLLDGSQTISINQFKRIGYQFLGWTLTSTPSDTDTVYTDGQAITVDFTQEDGATIKLYAKWTICTHLGHLAYVGENNILTESCSVCNGHSATAIISALNCVYDGNNHLATINYSTDWLGNKKLVISYIMAADAKWDSEDTIDDNWTSNSVPVHAGKYIAKISIGKDGTPQTDITKIATAQVEYTISPIKWDTPAVPVIKFTVQKDTTSGKYNSIITITNPTGTNIIYKITQLNKANNLEESVEGYRDWQTSTDFSNIPFGIYYYFYAKVSADRDHLESDQSKSTAYLTTGGNVIYIESGIGIKVEPIYGSGDFEYIVSAADEYHFRGYGDNLTGDEMIIGPSNMPGFIKPIDGVENSDAHLNDGGIVITRTFTDGKYQYIVKLIDGAVSYHQITLEFNGATKNASVTHKETDGQQFTDFNGEDNILISQDSAFTAQLTINDYIPEEYIVQSLFFSKNLPVGTTIIMKANGKYWYYKVLSVTNSVNLTEFTAMGGSEKFSYNTTETSPKSFTYQFIVDFSQVQVDLLAEGNLNMCLDLTASTNHHAPNITIANTDYNISLTIQQEASFEMNPTVSENKVDLNGIYTPSLGAASIWQGKHNALVLIAPIDAPADLTITVVIGGSTILYTMNENKKFIIPLGEIGSKEIKITMNSQLFGSDPKTYEFAAEWYVTSSSTAPLNGQCVAQIGTFNVSCKKDAVPSICIDGTDHILPVGGKLNLTVNYVGMPDNANITAYLQAKNETTKEYVDTGLNVTVLSNTNSEGGTTLSLPAGTTSKPIQFNMGEMGKGSYRILVIVQIDGQNILQVAYYFVIA